MFSVYGKAGRVFRGSMEELRRVGATTALVRTHGARAVGQDPQEHSPSHFADLVGTPTTSSAASSTPSPPLNDAQHRQAVAAYAENLKPDIARHPITRVDTIMSRSVLTVTDTLAPEHAWALLEKSGHAQAPVVDGSGMLVGMLLRADARHPHHMPTSESADLAERASPGQSVADVMWTPVPSVAADADIRRVAQVLLDTDLSGLPVVDEVGLVTGLVARSDILRAVAVDPPLDLWT